MMRVSDSLQLQPAADQRTFLKIICTTDHYYLRN